VAYRADNGTKLWEALTQTGIIAPPITYEVDGEQYVAVMAGWGGAFALVAGNAAQFAQKGPSGRMLVYKLGGTAQLPAFQRPARQLSPQPQTADEATLKKGYEQFHTYCAACHGASAISASLVPDLRYMTPATQAAFDKIVLEGAYKDVGMVSFGHLLNKADADAIRAYVNQRAHDQQAEDQAAGSWWQAVKNFFYSIAARALKLLLSLTS
jgi:quinohemoprotein ethanol dehydrogenase